MLRIDVLGNATMSKMHESMQGQEGTSSPHAHAQKVTTTISISINNAIFQEETKKACSHGTSIPQRFHIHPSTGLQTYFHTIVTFKHAPLEEAFKVSAGVAALLENPLEQTRFQ